jgi:hypothetical protein
MCLRCDVKNAGILMDRVTMDVWQYFAENDRVQVNKLMEAVKATPNDVAASVIALWGSSWVGIFVGGDL